MGRLFPQPKLFYQISLEERVPQDHLLRKIASIVDFSFLYDYVRPYYSHTGAPSADPVVIFKMALLGYLYGITSERKLAEECRLNLAFMWFLGYDLDEMPPDHSILSKARARFGREVYEQFFRHVVRLCQEAGLVEGDKVFLDATLLRANASLDSLVAREACHRRKETPKEYLDRVWEENPLEGPDDPDRSGSSGKNEMPREEAQEKKAAGKSPRTNEKWVSRTDPDASLVTRKGLSKPLLAHKVHIAVDGGRARIVTAVETTPGGVAECHVLPHLIGKHIFSTCSHPEEVVADRAYGTREVYRFLEGMGILPTIPRRQTWQNLREKRLKAGFRYDEKRDVYICPAGKILYRSKEQADGAVVYKVHRLACRGCPHRGTLCLAKRPSIKRRLDEELLYRVKSHLETERARVSLRQRKCWPETVFAEMKGPRGLHRATLRGTIRVHIQALLALAVHNIRQLVKAVERKRKRAAQVQALLRKVFVILCANPSWILVF